MLFRSVERIVLMGDSEVNEDDMLLMLPAFSNEDVVKTLSFKNKTLDEIEKELIEDTLKRHNGNRTLSAKAIGITLRQIGYKIKKFALKPPDFLNLGK